MKRLKLYVIGICIVLIFICVGLVTYITYYIVDVKSMNMQFEIADKIGFNVGTDAIYFGKTYPDGIAKRDVFLTNNHDFPITVSIKVRGSIQPLVTVSNNDFILNPNQIKEVTYYANAAGFAEGNYTGVTTLIFKRVII